MRQWRKTSPIDSVLRTISFSKSKPCLLGSSRNKSIALAKAPDCFFEELRTICAQGRLKEALLILRRPEVHVNAPLYACLLQGCAKAKALKQGKWVHAHILKVGLDQNLFLNNLLVSMYGKSGGEFDACNLFDRMLHRNVVSWTALLGSFAGKGNANNVFLIFSQMQLEGVKPNDVTFVIILNVCSSSEALRDGRLFHSQIVGNAFEWNVLVGTTLLIMYGKCGSLEDAFRIFKKMPQKDAFTWTAMISILVQHGLTCDALSSFWQMQLDNVKPNAITLLTILNACCSPIALATGRLIHSHIIDDGLASETVMETNLINMYGKCGSLLTASRIFNEMTKLDVFVWTAMIAAHISHDCHIEALRLFHKMLLEGQIPNKITYITISNFCSSPSDLTEAKLIHASAFNSRLQTDEELGNAFISMYAKCGHAFYARSIFDSMIKRNIITWTAMIAAYVQQGETGEVFKLFQEMQTEVKPNRVTYITILDACTALSEGRFIHDYILYMGLESDLVVGTSLVNMYGKCGSLQDAYSTFHNIECRDTHLWTAMITACAQHGDGNDIFLHFQKMQEEGVRPNDVSFISVLTACSRGGLIHEGCHYFMSTREYDLSQNIEQYRCMVDLLGKAGWMDQAEDFINKMPICPGSAGWLTMLGACSIHGDMARGKHAAKQAIDLDQHGSSAYIVLSNIYSAAGMWKEAERVRHMMIDRGLDAEDTGDLDHSSLYDSVMVHESRNQMVLP